MLARRWGFGKSLGPAVSKRIGLKAKRTSRGQDARSQRP